MNKSEDMYYRVAAKVLGVPVEEVTKEQRAAVKWISFGTQGGEDEVLKTVKLALFIGRELRKQRAIQE